MKISYWLAGFVLAGLMVGSVRAGEDAYLVKVVGFDRKAEWEAMSETDFKTLEKNIKLEQKYYSKALELAAKEWRTDELNKGVTFQGSRISPRAIMQKDKYASLDKASAAMARMQDQETKKTTGKKAVPPKKGKGTGSEMKEIQLDQAIALLKSKLDELVAKAGGAVNAAAPDAKDAKIDKKADAKEAVKKAL
ncbi:MAG: hypothetical protein WCI20_07065 [bacterium]